MSLPSSGSLSIGQIYQECGGTAFTQNENILSVRDTWWFADMSPTYDIMYDNGNGFAQVDGIINTTHPFRSVVDVNVDLEISTVAWNGYNYDYQPAGVQTIPQYGTHTGIFYIFYNCYNPYSCFLSSVYTANANPVSSGDYLYSTSFFDYYGKTRYNQYVAL